MRAATWTRRGERLRLLCLGAHPDDIEIGCGGTVLRLARENALASVTWVVLSGTDERRAEAEASASAYLRGVPASTVEVETFRDGHFPAEFVEMKRLFERLAASAAYDVVLTHARHDRHQDHRIVSDLTWNTWRDHVVLEYEVPKYDGDLVTPNLYVPLDDAVRRHKVALLVEHFVSQSHRHWFDEDALNAIMRLRGIECRAPSRYAEAFHARKIVF